MLLANFEPMLVKKELNVLAISTLSVIICSFYIFFIDLLTIIFIFCLRYSDSY